MYIVKQDDGHTDLQVFNELLECVMIEFYEISQSETLAMIELINDTINNHNNPTNLGSIELLSLRNKLNKMLG